MKTLIYFLLIIIIILILGCNNHHHIKTEYPALENYARKNKIQQKESYDYIYEYSLERGPKFNKKELEEFTKWRVK